MDDEYWHEDLPALLSQTGIAADGVSSVEEAQTRIEEGCYHLLVLDIQMEKDDPQNDEGLRLLRSFHGRGLIRGLNAVFKVIMLTGHGNEERMRDAFARQHVGDFIDKGEFKSDEFLQRVKELLAELEFRDDLVIHWQPVDAARLLVSGLVLGNTTVMPDNATLVSRAICELEDLLCRLFHDADSIIVESLTPGFSGARVLRVQSIGEDGASRPVIVKFGKYAQIEEEHRNYDTYVKRMMGGRSITVLERGRTMHLGGIVYSLLDASEDQVCEFDQFYRGARPVQIRQVLENLFFKTCHDWYVNLGKLAACKLTEEYQQSLHFTQEQLSHVLMEQLSEVEVTNATLTFHALSGSRTFTNPFETMANQRLVRTTYRCVTHGDLNQRNILVDTTGRAWLIDFARTGYSHFLRDIVLLDSVVRFELLTGDEATLEERLQLEELLLATENKSEKQRLNAGAALSNPHVAKAFAVTVHLRSLAKQVGGKNLRYDQSGYIEALLYTAMNAIKFYQMPMVQREHALLCASLIADHLK